MSKHISLKIQTPDNEQPLLFRDLLALQLSKWAKTISIKNLPRSDIIKISNIPYEDVEGIVQRIRLLGIEILEK